MKATRFIIVFLLVGTVIFLRWWFSYDQTLTGIDDANIYFVYAKNLAEGHGLVYNVGGERVEGFTSLLWVLILSIFYTAGPMEILAIIFNLLLISYTLYKLCSFADLLNTSSTDKPMGTAALVTMAFIVLIPGYLDWTILTIMETGLWSSLLVLTSLSLLKLWLDPRDKAAEKGLLYLIPLIIFTRPESIAWGIVFISIRLLQLLFNGNATLLSIRKVQPLIASYFVSLLLLLLFRLNYFGYPLPNTFYVKVSSDLVSNINDGFYYLLRYVKENPFVPLFLLTYLVSFVYIIRETILNKGNLPKISLLQLSILLIMGVHFLIPFYTGGDHFYLSRFFQPLYPLFLLGVFNGSFWRNHISGRIKEVKPALASLLGVAFCLLIVAATKFSLFRTSTIQKEFDIALYGRETGHQLNRLFRNDGKLPTVGTYLAGGLAYTYEGTTIDLLGLNNTLIGHAPKDFKGGYKNHSTFNKNVFYQIKPDIVHIDFMDKPDTALNESDSADFQNQVYKYIFLDKEFRTQYVPVMISAPEDNKWYKGYLQESYLEVLRKENHEFFKISSKNNMKEEQEALLLQIGQHSDRQ